MEIKWKKKKPRPVVNLNVGVMTYILLMTGKKVNSTDSVSVILSSENYRQDFNFLAL